MSRLAFRGRVEAPRPASAWVLVGVASATLWITGQLAMATMWAQAAMLVFSLWRREEPYAWQRSPITLNVGMLGVVTVTIAVALEGRPSTIALAHFAALTQGLQLMDARPRRTEFLLVTLALFQVILASNLTDSVFFPPLLVGFVCAAVWTLLVHTLRSEALEAGEPHAVGGAVTPGLLRTTLVASTLSVLLALVLFVSLPRLRSSVVRGSSFGQGLAAAGFSEQVELGDIGRIRQDARVVLRIETLEGPAPTPETGYWRGLALDHFDGRSWSVTPGLRTAVGGSPESGVEFGPRGSRVDLVQRIVREPVDGGALFRAGEAVELQGTVRRLERDASGGLYAPAQSDERIRYTVATREPRGREGVAPEDRAAPDLRNPFRDLQLPPLGERVAALAESIVAGAESDRERVRRVERYLIENGRYTDHPPSLDASSKESPVESFLFGGMAGHCEYFASAMVVLLRSVDIPARVVNGFAGGRRNEIGDFFEVARSNAHSWVEVHFLEAGWVRYDPTPPDLRLGLAPTLSLAERTRQLASALELWWFQRVVGFDRSDQIHALRRAWLAWRAAREDGSAQDAPRTVRPWSEAWRRDLADALPWLALAGAGGLLGFAWSRRGAAEELRAPRAYLRALRVLRRRGLVRAPAMPARDFARTVEAQVPQAAGVAFQRLTEIYLAERFGGRPPHPHAGLYLAALRAGLHARSH